MNSLIQLALSLFVSAPRVKRTNLQMAERGSVRFLWTRALDFLAQPPEAVHSSVPLQWTASSSRLVSHWVILEGCSKRMFWTLST